MGRRKATVVLEDLPTRTDDAAGHENQQIVPNTPTPSTARHLPRTPDATPKRLLDTPLATPSTSPRKRGRKAHVAISEASAEESECADGMDDFGDDSAYDGCDEGVSERTPRPAKGEKAKDRQESGKPKGRKKKTSEQTAEYKQHEEQILSSFFLNDYDEIAGSPCCCSASKSSLDLDGKLRLWRCTECFNTSACCKHCVADAHRNNPFHRIQRWTGEFFERATLRDAGLKFNLGHCGHRCPSAPMDASPTKMIVCDLHGFQIVDVVFCVCPGAARDMAQLLGARLFPATFSKPRTAFTWSLMEDLRLDTVQSKKPMYDYFTKLVRLSRNAEVNADKKGYENLSRAARFYNAAMRVRQSGQGQEIDKVLQTLYPGLLYEGSLMLPCPGCPHPGFNTPENVEELLKEPRQEHKYRVNVGVDGIYKLYQKNKLMDASDSSLFDGRGAFVHQAALDEFRKTFANYKDTGGSCPSVDRMHERTRVRGCLVSGIFALLCLRHLVFPGQSIIDILVGERFPDIDLAVMRAFGPQPVPWQTTLLSFDKNCQYWINFQRRIRDEFGAGSVQCELASRMQFCVPKFHISNHIEDCQYRFHPAHVPGAGRVTGEEVEQPWPEIGLVGIISRDANPGHRHELIEEAVSDWNFKKIVGQPRSLVKRAKDVASNLPRVKEFLALVTDGLDGERMARWVREFPSEGAVVLPDKEIKSRFKADSTKHPARQAVIDLLREESHLLGRGRGVLHMLHKGVKLELQKELLKRRLKGDTSSAAIRNERIAIRRELASWRPLRNKHIPVDDELGDTDAQPDNDDDLGKPEEEKLLLPSDYEASDRSELGLNELAQKQLKIHKGEAELAIAELCLAIRTFRTDVQYKQAEVSGQTASTRAQAAIKVTNNIRDDAAFKYKFHYERMLALGLDPLDEYFQPLKDGDTVAFNSTRDPEKLGSGRQSESWIWRGNKDVSFVDEKKRKRLDDLADDDLRVLYFRSLSQYLRWGEEGELVLEDLKRCIKSFTNYREMWKQLAARAQYDNEKLEREAIVADRRMVDYMTSLREGTHPGTPPESAVAIRERARVALGKRAYAYKKASFFDSMRVKSENALKEATSLIGPMVNDFSAHALELHEVEQEALKGGDEPEEQTRKRRRKGQ